MLRRITIAPVLNGFIVEVGCQTLAYTNPDKLLTDLGQYLSNPEETEKRLIETEGINRRHTLEQARSLGNGLVRGGLSETEPTPDCVSAVEMTACG